MSDLTNFPNYFNLTGKVALVTGGTYIHLISPQSTPQRGYDVYIQLIPSSTYRQ